MRDAGQTSAMWAGLRARISHNMLGGAGCGPGYVKICGAGWGGPNDIVAGWLRARLFQPAQFLSKCAHCLCLLVGKLPDSVCETLCVACTTAHVRRIYAVHACM